MSKPRIRIGVGGWTFPPWRGVFYPDKLPQSKELEYASTHLSAIEINATFYGRKSPKSWVAWERKVPDDFQFCVKGSRFCVTRSKLADGAEGIGNFVAQGFSALGPKLGPILWMFDKRRQFDGEDIAGFLKLLPSEVDGVPLRHALEPRNESFRDDAFYDLCRAHNVAVVYDHDDQFPTIDADTADFRYARLQDTHEHIETGYDAASLDRFEDMVRRWHGAGRECYVFFINGAKVRAPAAALALQERLSR